MRLLIHPLALTFAASLLVGCATVNPKPFAAYQSAVKEAQTGIDAAMSVNYSWTRSGFVEGFASNPEAKFSQLMIQPGAGYAWSLAADPIYLKVKETRAAMADLNGAFSDYAELLVKLASNELVSTDAFDELAAELNGNTKAAAKALSFDAPNEGFALFSTAASEAARLYIEKRRQKHLKEIIRKNQANVAEYAMQSIELIHTIRGSMKAYYVDRLEPIKQSWTASSGEKRLKATESALNLNEQFADAMRVLQELEVAYAELPKAHADLLTAIEKPSLTLHGIKDLYASGKRLQKLYKQLEKSE